MASIRKRGSSYQARITRKGFPAEVKTFSTKADADRWARSVESAMDVHRYQCTKSVESMVLADLIRRYRETVTPSKRGAVDEVIRLRALERDTIARYSVANVTPEVVADYRDRRLKSCSPSTVIRDLAVLSSIFSHARREWRIGSSNPVADVRKPISPPGRDRLLSRAEDERLLRHALPTGRRNRLLHPLLVVALETAMRRGELLGLLWCDVHLDRGIVRLPLTKNGTSRWVPLSSRAVAAIGSLHRAGVEKVFPISAAALDKMFRRLCTRAELEDLRFHDLRHTATTRLAERLPNVIELAAVTGHRSLQMLKRYYHPTAEALSAKLG
jgi:integrase